MAPRALLAPRPAPWLAALVLAVLAALAALGATRAAAQDDDRGLLEALLEDALSDAGRQVDIVGFSGALSSRATMERLTIADAQGVWIALEDVVLDWNRSALFSGRLEVNELTAARLSLPRLPDTGSGPSPEARGFALPELPVAVDIARLAIDRAEIGAAVAGKAATLQVSGSARLEEGSGGAALTVTRTDGPAGRFAFEAGYGRQSGELALSLELTEAPGGLAAGLLGLPGQPAVRLSIAGKGPVDGFVAEIALATDGAPRLAGQVTLTGQGTDAAPRRITAALAGDLRPLVQPDYRPFLGSEVRLAFRARRDGGGFEVEDLALTSDALQLGGSLALGPDNWPRRLALTLRIEDPAGGAGPVLVALPGPRTTVRRAALELAHDAAAGEDWRASLAIDGLARGPARIAALELTGAGRIAQAAPRGVSGSLEGSARGLATGDAALDAALGAALSGALDFAWSAGAPLRLDNLRLRGADYGLSGAITLGGQEGDGDDITAALALRLDAADLGRFSALAGTALSGAAELDLSGPVQLLGGGFDLAIAGRTRGLGIGLPVLAPLIAGDARLDMAVARDTSGTRLDRLEIATGAARLTASGRLSGAGSALRLTAQAGDLTALLPAAPAGPARLAGTAEQAAEGADWRLEADLELPGAASGTLVARLAPAAPLSGNGTLRLSLGDLAAYSALAGRPLSGSASLTAEAALAGAPLAGSVTLSGQTRDLGIGIVLADRLLSGTGGIDARVEIAPDGTALVRHARLDLPRLTADLSGSLSGAARELSGSLRIADAGLLADGVSGPVTASGRMRSEGGPWRVDVEATSAGGIAAEVRGTLATGGDGASDLAITGTAPLSLANAALAPTLVAGPARFDLRLSGPPGLAALTGTLRTEGATAVLPGQRIALDGLAGSARLAAGRAELDLSGRVVGGGRVAISGPVTLSPPWRASLGVLLDNVAVRDPRLYETTASGAVTLAGPLTGGATLSGEISLGPTEVRITELGGTASGALPGLRHVGAPPAVRATLERAGLAGRAKAGPEAAADAFGLDLLLRAPARIFLRGRGLDAEFGGQLRLRGTTADVLPSGRFELVRGRLDILGQRLTLTEGSVQLTGSFDPVLNVVAETRSGDITARIAVSGPATAPRVTLSSVPDLPEDEILARILFGRDVSRISPLQAVRLASAINTLMGGGGGDVVSRLRDRFGLDDLDVTTSEDGTTTARVGKYVGENVYADVTTDTAGKSEITLNLQLTPSLTARGSVDNAGNTGLGVFFERDY